MPLSTKSRKVHFVGIGGIGMSGLAELLHNMGHIVSGSDQNAKSERAIALQSLGISVSGSHMEETIASKAPDVVVYSSAINFDNPEIKAALKLNIPLLQRAEMLAEILRLYRGIAVAGSHGKTTTTALIAWILKSGGFDPTIYVGGKFESIGSNVQLGKGEWMTAEADESDGSFLQLSPEIGVITNIDFEHAGQYKDLSDVIKSFKDFVKKVPFYGKVIYCLDDPVLFEDFHHHINRPTITYGFLKERSPDYLILDERPKFSVLKKADTGYAKLLDFQLSIPGKHNVLNACAAIAIADELGVSSSAMQSACESFSGVKRRFEFRGLWKEHKIFDDYAHHPTEIQATIDAALERFDRPPIVIFQPHRVSRSRALWKDFQTCFQNARHVLITDTYLANESPSEEDQKFLGENFAQNILSPSAEFISSLDLIEKKLNSLKEDGTIKFGDPIFFLGAGNINSVIPHLIGGE